mmetsp:Transcript_28241/g.91465  ORF Transcript_28241/g.91465 Transcript_28241/m.91465 type:complete len:150 (-) Transcript_28241:57-506(-)
MIEQQRDQLEGMAWNMEQASFAHENIKTAINTSQAMKGGTAALKAEMKNVSIDDIEDNLDDMADLLDMTNEIQEAMARSYGVSDDIDEADLDDELAAIDEQLALDDELGESETPAYLQDEVAAPEAPQPARPISSNEQVDEFGLPMVAN